MKKLQRDTIKTAIVDKLAEHGVVLKPRGKAATKINTLSRLLTKGANEVIEGSNTLRKKADVGIKKVQDAATQFQLKAVDKLRKENPAGQFFPHTREKWTEAIKAKKTKLDYWDWVIEQIKS